MISTPPVAEQRAAFNHFLENTSPFCTWSPATIRQCVAEALPYSGHSGETLQHTGKPAAAVYLLTEGALDLMTDIGSGAWHGISRCHPGSVLGLHLAFLPAPQVRKQTWVASTNVLLWAVPNRVLVSCFWTDQALSRTVMAVLAGTINLLIDEVGYAALKELEGKEIIQVSRYRIEVLSVPGLIQVSDGTAG